MRNEVVSDVSIVAAVCTTVLICHILDVPVMTAVWTAVFISQAQRLPSRSNSYEGPQSHLFRIMLLMCDVSDEDRLRNVVLNDYGMATAED